VAVLVVAEKLASGRMQVENATVGPKFVDLRGLIFVTFAFYEATARARRTKRTATRAGMRRTAAASRSGGR